MNKYQVTKKAFQLYQSNNPKYFPLKFLHIIFENVSPYFNLWLSAEIVTALYEGRGKGELFALVAITLLGNLFIRIAGAFLSRTVDTQLEILSNNEAAAFNRKTLSLDYDKLENPEIRQLRRKITENAYINCYGVTFLRYSVETIMSDCIRIVFSLLFFIEMLSFMMRVRLHWFSVMLFIALILCVVLTIVFRAYSGHKVSEYSKKVGDLMLDENRYGRGYSTDGMDNRIYRQQSLIAKLNEQFNATHLKVFTDAQNKNFTLGMPTSVFEKLTVLCSYLIVCFYCTLGAFPVGSVIKYVGYLQNFIWAISNLIYLPNQLKENEPFLQVYLDYFDVKNDMYQGSLAVEKRSDKKFDIEFRNVSFQYAGADTFALKNINLDLKVGERLAVVGMNGGGKTTFIKLLCRLYDPTEGEILMNDFNIRKYDYRQYLDLFSVVFQDYNLLSLPLGNNVASAESWDTLKVERLLDEVGFGERYAQMGKGLDTPIYKDFDEDGVNVSGGEAQKIALARALYKDAPFIILDEPTAALDPVAEAEIYARFDEIVEDKTAIYISHRLSSCRFCDKIAVFDKGEIVQVGTHEELLADKNGKYHELWYAQAQYYTKTAGV